MTNSEKKNLDEGEGEEDSEKNDRPLSREGWIMFLGDKINERYRTMSVFAAICFAIALAGLSGIVAFIIAKMDVKYMHMLVIFSIFAIAFLLLVVERVRPKPIERIREGIIFEEEGFKTYDEIRDQCKNTGVILTKNNANKELEDGEEDLEEKDWGKNIKKQKEVLQVPQSDIRDIKKGLQEIKAILNWTSKFTSWSVVGSVGIAVGSVIMAISVTSSASSLRLGGLLLGLVMFLAGVFMINYVRKNLEKKKSRYV